MSNALSMGAQLAANAARFGWYYGVNRIVDREARRHGYRRTYKPKRPVPETRELMVSLAELLLADAENVRRGVCPPSEDEPGGIFEAVARVREMLADLPDALSRREAADAGSVREEHGAATVPDYYAQDFHFQTGGYLSPRSARLYDVQVDTLFYGTAGAMRRAALPAIADEVQGHDQRKLALLDIACGTGRFLRQVRLALPAMKLTGLDLSAAYLDEARRHLGKLRAAQFVEANAETIPLPDASQDIVSCIYLFHELPGEVRRVVAREIARVLKPGGLLVFVDSLQMGDRPQWDGMLEGFPVRFHEPYFRHYAIDDLDALFNAEGLVRESESLAFLSKVMVRRKSA